MSKLFPYLLIGVGGVAGGGRGGMRTGLEGRVPGDLVVMVLLVVVEVEVGFPLEVCIILNILLLYICKNFQFVSIMSELFPYLLSGGGGGGMMTGLAGGHAR